MGSARDLAALQSRLRHFSTNSEWHLGGTNLLVLVRNVEYGAPECGRPAAMLNCVVHSMAVTVPVACLVITQPKSRRTMDQRSLKKRLEHLRGALPNACSPRGRLPKPHHLRNQTLLSFGRSETPCVKTYVAFKTNFLVSMVQLDSYY